MRTSGCQAPSSKDFTNPPSQNTTPAWRWKLAVASAFDLWRSALLWACLGLLSLSNIRAQSYSIDWFTIDGGGGASIGGVYSISGTIGQSDAGHLANGKYSVDGGFWAIIAAVQTPAAPLLTIVRTSTNTVAISWPSPSTGYVLQQNTNAVGSVNWSNVVTSPSDDGTTKTVIVDAPARTAFYRLKQ